MHLLDIHREERLKVALAWSLNGLLATGHAFGWAAVHAMLVKRVGVTAMPVAYVFANFLGLVASAIYLRVADHVRRDRVLVRSALMLGGLLGAAWLMIEATGYARLSDAESQQQGLTSAALVFFGVGVAAHGVGKSTLKAQTWTLFNDIFRPSQGRRVYPVITTAKALGGMAGGVLVGPITSMFGLPACVLAWAISILLVCPLTVYLARHFGAELQGGRPRPRAQTEAGAHDETPPRFAEGLKYCLRSKLVGLLALLALVYWICNQLHDYQYTRIVNQTFGDEEHLGRWFGYYVSGFNVVCLTTQFLVAPRVLSWLGVGRSLLLQPLSGIIGFGSVLASFTFIPGLVLRGLWDLSEDGFYHSAFQLAFNAVPSEGRGRARGFVEGMVNPIGGMIGGLVIIALNMVNGPIDSFWHFQLLTVAGLGGSAVYLVLSLVARHAYVGAAIENLSHKDRRTMLDAVEALEERGHPAALARLEELSAAGETAVRRLALHCLARMHHPPTLGRITHLLDNPDPALREAALHAARAFHKAMARDHAEAWEHLMKRTREVIAGDDSPQVRAEAARLLLVSVAQGEVETIFHDLLADESGVVRLRVVATVESLRPVNLEALLAPLFADASMAVRAAAAAALWRAVPSAHAHARKILKDLLAVEDTSALVAVLRVVARLPTQEFIDIYARLLEHRDAEVALVAATALLASGATGHACWQRAVGDVATALIDPAREPLLRESLVPLFGEIPADALDALLASAARASPAHREQAARVLRGIYPALLKSLPHD